MFLASSLALSPRCLALYPWRRQGRWTNRRGLHRDLHAVVVEESLEIFALELDDVDHKATLGVLAGHAGHQAEEAWKRPSTSAVAPSKASAANLANPAFPPVFFSWPRRT